MVVFGRQAENVGRFCRKGKQLFIEGRIQTRKWQDKEGRDRYNTEIVANDVRFLGVAVKAPLTATAAEATTAAAATAAAVVAAATAAAAAVAVAVATKAAATKAAATKVAAAAVAVRCLTETTKSPSRVRWVP